MALDPEKMKAAGYYHHPDGNGVNWQRDLSFPGATEDTLGVAGYVGGNIGGKLNSLNDGLGMSIVFRPNSVSQRFDALAMAMNIARVHHYELTLAVDEAHQKQEVLDRALSDAQNRRLDAEIALENKKDAPAGERAQAALDLQNAVAEEFRAKILTEENAAYYIEADIMLNNGRLWWPESAEDVNKATEYIKQREADKRKTEQLIASDKNDLSTVTSAIEKTKQDIARIQNGEVLDKYRPENEKAAEVLTKTSELVADMGEKIGTHLGDKYKSVAKEIAEEIKNFQGKTIRSYDDAMKSLNKITSNPNLKINKGDKDAIVNAWKSFSASDTANKLGNMSRAFKVADVALKVEKVREKSIEGYETGNWGPLMLEVESWVLSGVAVGVGMGILSATASTIAATVGLPVTAITIVGIIGISYLSSFIDDKMAEKINNELIKPAH
ncbi:colicin-like pore-forming protein [Pectobacterium aroidearum]|uniref:colicin-like pore-forming protein n=1 Tax=Pectobacterium aroidearum TaxID=1201031 RepID=UPI003316477C